MPHPLRQQRGDLFDVERLFLADAEEYGGGAEVLAIEYLLLGEGEGVLGALGEVILGVGEDVFGAGIFPGIFYTR